MITTEELLEDAYNSFVKSYTGKNNYIILPPDDYITDNGELLSKEEFINNIKTNSKFANMWGVDVSVRELSLEERVEIARKTLSKEEFYKYGLISPFTTIMITYWLNPHNISTKVITITYNNKTIEVYE